MLLGNVFKTLCSDIYRVFDRSVIWNPDSCVANSPISFYKHFCFHPESEFFYTSRYFDILCITGNSFA